MTCIVIDDEQHAIDILVHYIRQTPQLQLVGAYTNPVEALTAVSNGEVQLVFLDIHMPELSGLDFIKAIGGRAKVILTTAYSEFALQGYELDVVDYLLKPVRLPRFLQAVQKAVALHREPTGGFAAPAPVEDFIFVKTESKGKLLKINLADIDYIEGMKNYVCIWCGGAKTIVHTSMRELEERLPPALFRRVHKSYIVALPRVTGIEGNVLRLKGVSADILIGEAYKAALMEEIRGKMIQ